MDVLDHVTSSLVLGAVLLPFFGRISLMVLVGGVLVDIDHLLLYLFRKRFRAKGFDLRRMYFFFKSDFTKNDLADNVFVFHTVEFLILMAVLSLFGIGFFMLFLGLLLHLILDRVYEMYLVKRVKRISLFVWM